MATRMTELRIPEADQTKILLQNARGGSNRRIARDLGIHRETGHSTSLPVVDRAKHSGLVTSAYQVSRHEGVHRTWCSCVRGYWRRVGDRCLGPRRTRARVATVPADAVLAEHVLFAIAAFRVNAWMAAIARHNCRALFS